ncbi:MAG: Zn-dependent hydrolase [Bacteroidales bacterium]|nr:Zn-dependent hydrolase [Bacteroidales bacterium]
MKKYILTLVALALLGTGCNALRAQSKESTDIKQKLSQYATFPLRYDLHRLSPNEQELIAIFIQIADVMDEIYWEQSFGQANRKLLRKVEDGDARRFAEIQYGAWDRLDGNKPFIKSFGPKPAGANFYPADMKPEEFEKLDDPNKTSPYTIIQRGNDGKLMVVPYSRAYERQLRRVDMLLERAIRIADDDGLRRYLEARRAALKDNDYLKSDMTWMEMKDSRIDFVFGPIESYEDGLYGYKTAFEAFVLVKDEDWSNKLERYTRMLPDLQKSLPCEDKYKKEMPGTNSDLNVYDVLYYAGDCNAGGKTIAINLPNDERVQLKMGTRRLQLKNAMQAKFDLILQPIAKELIDGSQLKNVKFNAFFNNVCFHEVAHGLGVKNTIDGKRTVREALQNQYSAYEEAKADICGLYIVQKLIDNGDIRDITIEYAYVTYMASLLRSVRFGATEAHGIANIMCFNFMEDKGAFTRGKNGKYTVNVEKMHRALAEWAALVIKTEGDGDYKTAKTYAEKNGVVRPSLAADLKKLEQANIPVDIRFDQGARVLNIDERMMKGEPRQAGLQPANTGAKNNPFERR